MSASIEARKAPLCFLCDAIQSGPDQRELSGIPQRENDPKRCTRSRISWRGNPFGRRFETIDLKSLVILDLAVQRKRGEIDTQ